MTDSPNETRKTAPAPHGSTLIEFPGVNRNRPAWRKELSEKVREIQQRRAREAAVEAGDRPAPARNATTAAKVADVPAAQAADAPAAPTAENPAAGEETAKQLGLVPPPEMNPLVVAALRRIERARTRAPHASRPAHGRAQAAAARVIEEQFEQEEERSPSPLLVVAAPKAEVRNRPQPAAEAAPTVETSAAAVTAPGAKQARPATASPEVAARTSTAVRTVTPPPGEASSAAAPSTKAVPVTNGAGSGVAIAEDSVAASDRPQPRKIAGVIDDHWLERHGTDPLPKVEAAAYDDRAPIGGRVGAALFDLLVVTFLCAPFAAVIELTIGEWQDPRVLGSMGGIVAVVMFLYHTCAVALAGRSWGMHLFSLHAVDADSASVPTTWQCAVRAVVYMLSLLSFGLGLLYALLDAERRTAHDLLSRTVVVKE
jgi:uncharacterized RDD family membrane protein YckC